MQRDTVRSQLDRQPDKPVVQDTIFAAGREWSAADKLADLRRLNEHLWDNRSEWLPRDDYLKLVAWIRDKEQLRQVSEKQKSESSGDPATNKGTEQHKGAFEYQGQQYSRKDSFEKLDGLRQQLREKDERLPIDDYQKLRAWLEHRDRERFAGILEKQLNQAKVNQSQEEKAGNSPQAGRYVPPLQQELMKNPVMGLFMTQASIAAELVRSIPLDDRNRDYAAEARYELEDAKKDIEQRRRGRKTEDEKVRDDEAIEDIDKTIDEQKEEKRKQRKEREKDKDKRDRDTDFLR